MRCRAGSRTAPLVNWVDVRFRGFSAFFRTRAGIKELKQLLELIA